MSVPPPSQASIGAGVAALVRIVFSLFRQGLPGSALLLATIIIAGCGGDGGTEPDAPDVPAAVRIVSGHEQQGVVGQELRQPVVVEVVDGKGKPIANQHVNFRVVTGGGSVFAGAAVTNRQGVAQERWTLGTVAWSPQRLEARAVDNETGAPLVYAAFEATAVPDEAVSLAKAGGDQQTGALGTQLPDSLAVRAVDQYGNGVRGVAVTWSLAFGGGELSATSATTDSLGFARVAWTIGTRLDAPLVVTASAGELGTLTFSATAGLPATAGVAAFGGSGQQVEIGMVAPQALAARVTLADGRPVSGIAVNWAVTGGGGTITPPTSITDATGTAVAQLTTGTTAGPNTVTATVAGLAPATFTVEALPGPPARVTLVSGDGLRASVGTVTPVPPSVQVLDRGDNPVPNVAVTWAVTAGGGSIVPASPTSDATGVARATWTLGPLVGSQTATATVQGLQPVTFTATATSGAVARLEVVSGAGQTGTVGATLATPIVVRVTDRFGNRVGAQRVTFTPAQGSGSTSPPYGNTNAAGELSVQWQLGTTAGPQTLRVSVDTLPPVMITATAVGGAPTQIAILSGDQQIGIAGQPLTAPLVVRVTDANGNPAANAAVTWSANAACGSLTPTSTTTNASGEASAVWTLGASTRQCRLAGEGVTAMLGAGGPNVRFTAVMTGTSPAVIHAGNYADQVGVIDAPTTLTAYVEDASENPVPSVGVNFTVTAGGGTLSSASAATDVAGRASVSFTPGTVAGNNRVQASIAAGASTSFLVWTRSGPAVRIVRLSGDGQTGPLGQALPESLSIRVEDQHGNGVYREQVQFAVTMGNGYTERLSLTTDTLGIASTRWILGSIGANAATATWGGQVSSFGATGTAGSGLSVLIVSGNEQSVRANAFGNSTTPSLPFVARAVDAQGNPVAGQTVTWQSDFSNVSDVTDASGLTTFSSARIYNYSAGLSSVIATLANGASVRFTVVIVTARDNLSAVPRYTGPGSVRAGTRLPVPIVAVCFYRTGPADGCSGRVTDQYQQGSGGTLIPAPGFYPPNEAAYYWILPPQPGTYYFWASAGSNSNYEAVTATP